MIIENMRSRFWILSVGVATVGIFLATLFFSTRSTAAPTVSWTPSSITRDVVPGQTQVVPASFTASENLNNAVVTVDPALQPVLKLLPSNLANIQKGQAITLNLVFSSSPTALPGSFQGAIYLLVGSTVITDQLPVVVRITWPHFADTARGISFSYPTFGMSDSSVTATDSADDSGSTFYEIVYGTPSTSPTSQYGFTVTSNSNGDTLDSWFAKNVDFDGSLIRSGAYQNLQLANGMRALLLTTSPPQDYLDNYGPITNLYAMSQDGKYFIVVSVSQDSDFNVLGIGPDAQTQAFLTMLGSMAFH